MCGDEDYGDLADALSARKRTFNAEIPVLKDDAGRR